MATDETVAGNNCAAFNGRHRAHEAVNLVKIGFCAVLRGSWGHGHDAHDCTGVFSRHHGRRSDVHQRDEASDADHDQCYGENRTLDEAQHVFLIFLQDVVVAMIEGSLEFLRTHADQSDDTDDAEGCGDDWM